MKFYIKLENTVKTLYLEVSPLLTVKEFLGYARKQCIREFELPENSVLLFENVGCQMPNEGILRPSGCFIGEYYSNNCISLYAKIRQ
jgi:hypothetical protein